VKLRPPKYSILGLNLAMYTKPVGIYMPTRNRVELLKKAIASVQAQSYQNFKLVIVNDGSTDGTQAFLDSIVDLRISFIENIEPEGACASRNKAIISLDTELITGLDDDDVFLPERLADLLSVYDEKYAFVCSGYFWDYGAYKKPLFTKDREISLSDAFDLNQCSNQILVNRKRVLGISGFDENILALQDHDLWVRLIDKFGPAFRRGTPSYIVNDDRSFERISSVKNKLDAIAFFEKKHDYLMSKRNKENFYFYKIKISGRDFSFLDFFKSIQYGLFGLKCRLYFSTYFKNLSKTRLIYLRTGSFSKFFLSLVNSIFTVKGCVILLLLAFIFFSLISTP
jgi:glycosyltransferase involved in cell wall biosynthesis